jgi:hypothetical protein
VSRQAHRGQAEHQVRGDRAEHAAGQLGGQVDGQLPRRHPTEDPVGQGDHRVEVRPGDRAEAKMRATRPAPVTTAFSNSCSPWLLE